MEKVKENKRFGIQVTTPYVASIKRCCMVLSDSGDLDLKYQQILSANIAKQNKEIIKQYNFESTLKSHYN